VTCLQLVILTTNIQRSFALSFVSKFYRAMEITPELAEKHLDKFKPYVYSEIPKDKRITVWVEREQGFMINDLNENLGLEALVATSWIEHDKLEELCVG
jgi:hypothetical protein